MVPRLPSSDFTFSGSTSQTNAGSSTETWTFSNPNYATQSGTVDPSIAQAPLTITSSNVTKVYGTTYDLTQLSFIVNGTMYGSYVVQHVDKASDGAASGATLAATPSPPAMRAGWA